MTHLNTVPEEMGFVLCFETGNLINWYWISGVEANGEGSRQDGSQQPPKRTGVVKRHWEGWCGRALQPGFGICKTELLIAVL